MNITNDFKCVLHIIHTNPFNYYRLSKNISRIFKHANNAFSCGFFVESMSFVFERFSASPLVIFVCRGILPESGKAIDQWFLEWRQHPSTFFTGDFNTCRRNPMRILENPRAYVTPTQPNKFFAQCPPFFPNTHTRRGQVSCFIGFTVLSTC